MREKFEYSLRDLLLRIQHPYLLHPIDVHFAKIKLPLMERERVREIDRRVSSRLAAISRPIFPAGSLRDAIYGVSPTNIRGLASARTKYDSGKAVKSSQSHLPNLLTKYCHGMQCIQLTPARHISKRQRTSPGIHRGVWPPCVGRDAMSGRLWHSVRPRAVGQCSLGCVGRGTARQLRKYLFRRVAR